jgi:hypothetical protein
MKRWWIVAVAALSVTGLAAPSARAQNPIGGYAPPQVQGRPTVSPYLNLARPGSNPAINYYGLVRPQIQTQQQLMNLQGQQNVLATELGGNLVIPGQAVPIATTGHPVYYFDYARFFPIGGLPNGMGMGYGTPGMGGMGAGGFGRTPVPPVPGFVGVGVGVGATAPR